MRHGIGSLHNNIGRLGDFACAGADKLAKRAGSVSDGQSVAYASGSSFLRGFAQSGGGGLLADLTEEAFPGGGICRRFGDGLFEIFQQLRRTAVALRLVVMMK